MCFQPQAGWRHVIVTAQRTKRDYAFCMKRFVDEYVPTVQVIRVSHDHLNTHTPAALYDAFSPPEARRLVNKPEFH